MRKFSDVMFADLTEEQVRGLPRDQAAAWLMRPQRLEIVRAKHFMYLRVVLILGAIAYLLSDPMTAGEATVLLLALISYEFGYYNLRREKCEREYAAALHQYCELAKTLDSLT